MIDLLYMLLVPILFWDEKMVNFITGLPTSKGCIVIFIVVNCFTKFAHFGVLLMLFIESTMIEALASMVVKLHDFLSFIIVDCEPIFLSNFCKKLFKLSGITHALVRNGE